MAEKSNNKSTTKYIDYLDEDEPLNGQLYVCISFLSPEGVKNCSMRGLKIRGVYPSYDLAKARAEILRKKDPHFDVFVGEVGKWLPWDDKDKSYDVEHMNNELNDLMRKYKENKDKSNMLYEQRKNEMQSGRYEQRRIKKMQQRLRKKMEKDGKTTVTLPGGAKGQVEFVTEKDVQREMVENNGVKLEDLQRQMKEKEAALERRQKELFNKRKEITKKESNGNTVNDRMKDIDAIYNKLATDN
jgi:hypothetical protein